MWSRFSPLSSQIVDPPYPWAFEKMAASGCKLLIFENAQPELFLRELGTGEAYAPKTDHPIRLLEEFLMLFTDGDLSPFVGSICSYVLSMLNSYSENPASDLNLHINFLHLYCLIRVHLILQSQRRVIVDIAFKTLRAYSDDRGKMSFSLLSDLCAMYQKEEASRTIGLLH
jgi:hypothetical protein